MGGEREREAYRGEKINSDRKLIKSEELIKIEEIAVEFFIGLAGESKLDRCCRR